MAGSPLQRNFLTEILYSGDNINHGTNIAIFFNDYTANDLIFKTVS